MSGCLSAMLGIGGGLIISPLLLEIGLHPLIASSTSNFLVLFTSSSTSIQFSLFGMVKQDYGLILLIPGESLFSLINAIMNGQTIFNINSPCN